MDFEILLRTLVSLNQNLLHEQSEVHKPFVKIPGISSTGFPVDVPLLQGFL